MSRSDDRAVPDGELQAELVRVVFRHAPDSLLGNLVVALFVFVAAWGDVGAGVLSGWLLTLTAVTMARAWLVRSFVRARPEGDATVRWRDRYALGALAAGVLWGACGLMLAGSGQFLREGFAAFVVAGMAAGSIGANAADRRVFLAFLVPCVAPLAVLFATRGDLQHLAMAGMIGAFLTLLIHLASRYLRVLHQSLSASLANLALARELQATRAELADSEYELRTIVETEPECVMLLAADGSVQRMNAAGLRMLEARDAGEVLGHPFQRLVAGDSRLAFERLLRRVFAGESDRLEFGAVGLSGSARWLETHAVPMRDDTGAVRALLAITRDITERRRVEGLLRTSEARFRNLADNLTDWIWEMDLEGRYTYSNERGASLLGMAREAFLASRPGSLIHPVDRVRHAALLKHAIATGSGWRGELFRWRARDGRYHSFESSASPTFAADGMLTGFQGVDRDVTERLAAEAELEHHRHHLEALVEERTAQLAAAKSAAEAASLTKSTFLANMSHEIRTPLNAITGMAQLIRRGGVTPEQGERLDKLQHAGAHLLEVINAILDLSKIEAGKLELAQQEVHVEAMLASVASMMQQRLQDKGLELVIDQVLPPGALIGDATRLQQALLNYVANAVRFTERGTITVRVAAEAEQADRVVLRFEVHDTGVGIAPEVLPRLFDRFEQADGTGTEARAGTGLGLAITRKLARLMGGEAGARSVPGEGSTFWFTARLRRGASSPAAMPAVASSSAEASLRRAHAGRRLLVVEDDAVNREIAQCLLEAAGLRVELAEDGRQAVARAAEQDYDAILMDVQLPDVDGLEATRRIRRLARARHTPIVAMTANAFAEDRARCKAAGMKGFVSKPFEADALFAAVLDSLAAAEAVGESG